MKYIRTKDYNLIYNTKNLIKCEDSRFPNGWFTKTGVPLIAIKQADTIEELCDEFVIINNENEMEVIHNFNFAKNSCIYDVLYGAIWTDKGLIYVAKMNEDDELELL